MSPLTRGPQRTKSAWRLDKFDDHPPRLMRYPSFCPSPHPFRQRWSGSLKGSLAVNTAEKQRAQSISHLRRQAIDQAAEPHCLFSLPFCWLSKAITLREAITECWATLLSCINSSIRLLRARRENSNGRPAEPELQLTSWEIRSNWFRSAQMHKMIPEESLCEMPKGHTVATRVSFKAVLRECEKS